MQPDITLTITCSPIADERRKLMALYSRDNARRSLIDTVAYRAMSQVATALGYVVMVRAMTEEDFGIFNLLYAFIPFVSTFASLGLDQTLSALSARVPAEQDTRCWRLARTIRRIRETRHKHRSAEPDTARLELLRTFFKLTAYKAEFAFFCLLVLLHFQASILQLSLASHMLHRFSVGSTAALAVVS
jgi:hypothetical protein